MKPSTIMIFPAAAPPRKAPAIIAICNPPNWACTSTGRAASDRAAARASTARLRAKPSASWPAPAPMQSSNAAGASRCMIRAAEAVLPMPISPITRASASEPAAISAPRRRACSTSTSVSAGSTAALREPRRTLASISTGCEAMSASTPASTTDDVAGAGERVDARAAGQEGRDHGEGDSGRIGRHTLGVHAVIAGEDVGFHPVDAGRFRSLHQADLDRQVLQPAERARRLGLAVHQGAQAGGERGIERREGGRDVAHRPTILARAGMSRLASSMAATSSRAASILWARSCPVEAAPRQASKAVRAEPRSNRPWT